MLKRRRFLSITGKTSALFSLLPFSARETFFMHDFQYDLIVIGGTPGGVACALRAAREGLKVLLTNYNNHFGGMLVNGMGVWDTLYEGRRSPIYDELRQRIINFYKQKYGEGSSQYLTAMPGKTGHTNGTFEAWVAERVIREMLEESGNIELLGNAQPIAAVRKNNKIESVQFNVNGEKLTLKAKIFADCTYEGDLLPLVETPHTIGREAVSTYDEPHAGEVYMRLLGEKDNFQTPREKKVYEGLNIRKFGTPQEKVMPQSSGKGDEQVQAFNLRTILTKDPEKRIKPNRPPNYNRDKVKDLHYNVLVQPIPNKKASWNRPQMLDVQGDYIRSSPAERKRIIAAFKETAIALLYFLQNDPEVKPEVQKEWQEYGLASDEFTDNNHFPYEIYVREGRRLKGQYVFTQHDAMLSKDINRTPVHHDSIGITEWYIDNHHATDRRAVNNEKEGWIMKDGKITLYKETFPAQVPYRSLLARDLDNLLVPVCLSASHVGWGTIRLEPTWLNIAESAGFAAALAVKTGQSLNDIDVEKLLIRLAEARVMISFFNDVDLSEKDEWIPAAQYFGTKGFFNSYNVKANEVLDMATAERWISGLKNIQQKQPMQIAKALQMTEPGKSITRGQFMMMLQEAGLKGKQLGFSSRQETPILRGKALVICFELVKEMHG